VSAAGLLAAAALGFAASASAAPAGASYGILLLAHGGDPSWNAAVEKLRVEVDSSVATELALGMADPITLQAGVDALQRRGVSRIVAVPLFVDSRSEVLDQTRYALGLTDDPSDVMRAAVERLKASGHMGAGAGHHHMMIFSLDRVKLKVPIALAAALDDDPFVSRVLLERAKALSRDPKKETVFLVAHGPVDGAAVGVWQNHLSAHSESVRREGGLSRRVLRGPARRRGPGRPRGRRRGPARARGGRAQRRRERDRGPGADRARRDRGQDPARSRRPDLRVERRRAPAARGLRGLGPAPGAVRAGARAMTSSSTGLTPLDAN